MLADRWGPPRLASLVETDLRAHGFARPDARECSRRLAGSVGPAARASLFVDLGGCNFLDGDLEGAIGSWRRAISSGQAAPAARAMLYLGLAYEQLGLFDRAASVLSSAVDQALAPFAQTASLALARTLLDRGDGEAAMEHLAALTEPMLLRDPDGADTAHALFALGCVAHAVGRIDRAERAWRAGSAGESAWARRSHGELISLFGSIGRDEEARELVQQFEGSAGDGLGAEQRLERAAFLSEHGRRDHALELIAAIDGPSLQAPDRFRLAELSLREGLVNEAIDELEDLLGHEQSDHSLRAALMLGDVYRAHEMPDEARQMYERAAAADHPWWSAVAAVTVGDLHYRNGESESAVEHWVRAAQSDVAELRKLAQARLTMGVEAARELTASDEPVALPEVVIEGQANGPFALVEPDEDGSEPALLEAMMWIDGPAASTDVGSHDAPDPLEDKSGDIEIPRVELPATEVGASGPDLPSSDGDGVPTGPVDVIDIRNPDPGALDAVVDDAPSADGDPDRTDHVDGEGGMAADPVPDAPVDAELVEDVQAVEPDPVDAESADADDFWADDRPIADWTDEAATFALLDPVNDLVTDLPSEPELRAHPPVVDPPPSGADGGGSAHVDPVDPVGPTAAVVEPIEIRLGTVRDESSADATATDATLIDLTEPAPGAAMVGTAAGDTAIVAEPPAPMQIRLGAPRPPTAPATEPDPQPTEIRLRPVATADELPAEPTLPAPEVPDLPVEQTRLGSDATVAATESTVGSPVPAEPIEIRLGAMGTDAAPIELDVGVDAAAPGSLVSARNPWEVPGGSHAGLQWGEPDGAPGTADDPDRALAPGHLGATGSATTESEGGEEEPDWQSIVDSWDPATSPPRLPPPPRRSDGMFSRLSE